MEGGIHNWTYRRIVSSPEIEKTEEQIEEERRLFYVAMTRAKRHLLITAPVVSSGYSGGISKRSRFINELAEETINTEIHTRDEYSYGSRGGQTQFYF